MSQIITDRSDASLGMYLKDIYREVLITPEEEIELSNRIQNGDDEALDKLVRANLRFVITIAKQYQHKGLSLVDLIQEGNLGLIHSAKTYSADKGVKFISYAVWWIRQSILKALSDQCRTVRIPLSQVIINSKVNKLTTRFEQQYGYKPTMTEIGMDEDTFVAPAGFAISLDTAFKDDEETGCLLDIIPNQNVVKPDSEISAQNTSVIINDILENLSYRNRDCIKMFFGIGMESMQYQEIAWRFGIGEESVRQIVRDTLIYLKDNYGDELKELL